MAIILSGILPSIERFGVLVTYSSAAVISWANLGYAIALRSHELVPTLKCLQFAFSHD